METVAADEGALRESEVAIDPGPSPRHLNSRVNIVEEEIEELAAAVEDLESGEWLPTPVAYLILGQIATTGALVGWMLGRYLRGG